MRAFGLFSGGLDSILAARLLLDQGLKPTLITFTSPFFTPEKALKSAEMLGLEPLLVDITSELLALVKSPAHARGRHLNPCIDCHALMFRKAGDILEACGEPGFLFSGEILGQRPLSQTRASLNLVAKSSGRRELILRPLSALSLPPSEAELQGWVNRDGLLGLSGRGRRAQLALAEKYGFKDFPAPAGGCLLTDPIFAHRLGWILSQPQARQTDWPGRRLLEILKHGRLFSAEPGHWIMVGRRQSENQALAALAEPSDLQAHIEGRPGPVVLWPEAAPASAPQTVRLAVILAAAYAGPADGPAQIRLSGLVNGLETIDQPPAPAELTGCLIAAPEK